MNTEKWNIDKRILVIAMISTINYVALHYPNIYKELDFWNLNIRILEGVWDQQINIPKKTS